MVAHGPGGHLLVLVETWLNWSPSLGPILLVLKGHTALSPSAKWNREICRKLLDQLLESLAPELGDQKCPHFSLWFNYN